MNVVYNGASSVRALHQSRSECDRWIDDHGRNGCPHFTDAQVAALKRAGQWPGTATFPLPERGYLLVN